MSRVAALGFTSVAHASQSRLGAAVAFVCVFGILMSERSLGVRARISDASAERMGLSLAHTQVSEDRRIDESMNAERSCCSSGMEGIGLRVFARVEMEVV